MAVQNITPIDPVTSSVIAQSALAQSPAAAGLDLSRELIVVAIPDIYLTEYQGTRAALEAEGVIPSSTKWPTGFDDLHWDDGRLRYWLRRQRPEGVKGARNSLLNIDWWMLRCDPCSSSPEILSVERKAKELAAARFLASPEGAEVKSRRWNAWLEARTDDKFQAFKALIPGLIRPKRGRRSGD